QRPRQPRRSAPEERPDRGSDAGVRGGVEDRPEERTCPADTARAGGLEREWRSPAGAAVRKLLQESSDGRTRCFWCGEDPLYVAYHDREWGFPQRDDRRLYEKVCLEGFQAGLAWITILRKRANFRAAFEDFDFE